MTQFRADSPICRRWSGLPNRPESPSLTRRALSRYWASRRSSGSGWGSSRGHRASAASPSGKAAGLGFSYVISTGNEASLDMSDALDFLVEDPDTRVICLAVESVRRPQAFLEAVNRAIAAATP